MKKRLTVAFRNSDPDVNGGRCFVRFEIQSRADVDKLAEQHGVENLLYLEEREYADS